MDINSFNEKYFNNTVAKITEEKKICYLAGDFNIDLLKSDSDNHTKDFFDTLTSNLFVPHITLPTRITNRSQTLIDNIFSNNPEFENCTSGNFTFSISDHLAQFLYLMLTNSLLKHITLKSGTQGTTHMKNWLQIS